MMHSVETRFIAIVSSAMLIFVVPLIILFLILSANREARNQVQQSETLLQIASQALAKPVWDFDEDGVRNVVTSISSAGDLQSVRVRNTSGSIDIRFPATEVKAADGEVRLSRAIQHTVFGRVTNIGTVETTLASGGLMPHLNKDELAVLAILIVAVGIVFASALFSNRVIVMIPLMRLTAAIEATRRQGSRHHVDWTSSDEMGALAQNFNEMQSKLEREETELKLAHRLATDIYNLTPAMLFSLDRTGRVTAVSDYWLLATGYARDEVLGRDFTDFVAPEAHTFYAARDTRQTDNGAQICEVTVPFVKRDGSRMVVLILETHELGREDGPSLSLSVMTDVTELKLAESRNHTQAMTDHLTGMLNRQGFELALDTAIRHADDHALELACIFIDLDRFKWVNDNFGHAQGDDVLREVATRIKATLGVKDMMSRLGGDEFAILISGGDAQVRAIDIGEEICRALRRAFVVQGSDVTVSSSIGISVYPLHAASAAELLLTSDMAMYARKRDGKNGVSLFDAGMLETARERLEIEQYIELGLKENWFEAYLQPIVSLADGRIAGFEALMRLQHPEKGVLPPGKIIGIAEETGTITSIGTRILEKAIENLARITALDGTQETYVAVNFSPLQFEESLPHKLAALLLKHHISPNRVVIEITEAVLMLDNPQVHTILNQLREFGCRIALDDFGTGYSSLSYLNRFPVDIVKIDQSFTRSLTGETFEQRRKSRMLIKGIRTISHQMGCTIVAEGIETEEQWDLLRKLAIDCGQGYLFSRPKPIHEMLVMLEAETEAKVGHPA